MKRILAAATLILPLIGVLPAAAQTNGGDGVAVVAIKSSAQPFVDTLVLRGRTEAERRVDVRSETAGLVNSPPLEKGATVKAGDLLCQLDEGDRTAELTEAKARLIEAEIEFDAADRLAKKGFGAEMKTNTALAKLEAAKARVLRAEIDLNRTRIRAPFDGILETDTAELGSLLQNGSICAGVIALNPIKLVAFSPERSVDDLHEGLRVRARLITGREIDAAITHVARSADRDTRTYLVEAETPNGDLSIRDGMTAELVIALEGKPAHRLPQTALTLNENGELGVRLVEEDVARFASVAILRDEPGGVWVAGLPDQADVIVVGQEFVIDGARVRAEYLQQGATQ